MPAFFSETDPRKPRWKRREGQDLLCMLLLLLQLAPPPNEVPQWAGAAGSVARVTPGRAMQCLISKAEILL